MVAPAAFSTVCLTSSRGVRFAATTITKASDSLASISGSGEQVLDKFLNIPPTVTIREGSRVKIYLSDDLLLPDYQLHTVRPDL